VVVAPENIPSEIVRSWPYDRVMSSRRSKEESLRVISWSDPCSKLRINIEMAQKLKAQGLKLKA
jgi:hypothetical protein